MRSGSSIRGSIGLRCGLAPDVQDKTWPLGWAVNWCPCRGSWVAFWPSQHLTAMRCEPLEVSPRPSLFCSPHAFQHLLGPSPGRVLQVPWAPDRAATQRTSGCHKKPRGTQLDQPEEQREGFLGWRGWGWVGIESFERRTKVRPVEKEGRTLGLEPGHCTEFSKGEGKPCCGVRWKGMLARWGTAPGQCRLHLTVGSAALLARRAIKGRRQGQT